MEIRQQVGILSTALAFFGVAVVALPLIPPEQKMAVGAVTLGLWGIGVGALEPYLSSPSNNNRTTSPKK